MKRTLTSLVLALPVVASGCAMSGAPAEPPAPMPQFRYDFTPPSVSAPGSAGIVFAVVEPQWAKAKQNAGYSAIFGNLNAALKDEFLEAVIARGFITRGDVVASRDELLYPDKKASDMVLVPDLEIEFQFDELTAGGAPIPIIGHFAVDGRATIRGRVVLNAYESLSNNKMWTKPIVLEPITIAWVGESQNRDITLKDQQARWPALAVTDPGFRRALIPQVNEVFQKVMQSAWDYLDPAEFQAMKKDLDALKKSAVTEIR